VVYAHTLLLLNPHFLPHVFRLVVQLHSYTLASPRSSVTMIPDHDRYTIRLPAYRLTYRERFHPYARVRPTVERESLEYAFMVCRGMRFRDVARGRDAHALLQHTVDVRDFEHFEAPAVHWVGIRA
jgi:hypothetical protein